MKLRGHRCIVHQEFYEIEMEIVELRARRDFAAVLAELDEVAGWLPAKIGGPFYAGGKHVEALRDDYLEKEKEYLS